MSTSAFDTGMADLFALVTHKDKSKRITQEEFRARATTLQQASIPVRAVKGPAVSQSTRPQPLVFDESTTVDNLPPATDQTIVSHHASSLYTPVSTREIARVGEGFGFFPVRYSEQARNERTLLDGSKSRPRDPLTTPHMLTLRRRQDVARLAVGQTIVQALITNSSDLSTPLSISLGLYECVCTNQAISQRSGFAVRMRHVGLVLDDVKLSMESLFSNVDTMLSQSEVLKAVTLTRPQALEFATRAIPLRWSETADNGDLVVSRHAPRAEQLLSVRYSQQGDPTLYNAYQNVQRNILDGGFVVPSNGGVRKNGAPKSDSRIAKKIVGLKQVVAINTGLDALLADYATDLGVSLPEPARVYEPNYTVLS